MRAGHFVVVLFDGGSMRTSRHDNSNASVKITGSRGSYHFDINLVALLFQEMLGHVGVKHYLLLCQRGSWWSRKPVQKVASYLGRTKGQCTPSRSALRQSLVTLDLQRSVTYIHMRPVDKICMLLRQDMNR